MYVVTGGAGFIGSNIVRALNERGEDDILVVDDLTQEGRYLNLCDCRIRDYMDRAEFLERVRRRGLPERTRGVCHQGACADTMESDGRYMMENNFTYSRDLLDAAEARGVPFVYASSAAVYGAGETFRPEASCERPLNVYGLSKLVFDQHVRARAEEFSSTVVGLRYFNVYGPREAHKGSMASMPYQLYRQLKASGVARLFQGTGGYGDGEQRRDFISVDDVVRTNLYFLERREPLTAIVNCGVGASRSFNDVAKVLIDRLGSGRIEYIPIPGSLRGRYQSFTEADITSLRGAGYDRPMGPLEEGIASSLDAWEQEWEREQSE